MLRKESVRFLPLLSLISVLATQTEELGKVSKDKWVVRWRPPFGPRKGNLLEREGISLSKQGVSSEECKNPWSGVV